MKQKGFTLVELIAMMVVIGVLMAIAIPNISGIVKKNRESIGVEDVNKMIGNTKTKLETGQAKYPKKNECTVLTLNFIDNNNDFKTGINGGYYDKSESVIVVKKSQISGSSYEYKYFFRLIEKEDGNSYVMGFADYDDFSKNPNNYTPNRVTLGTNDLFNMPTATKDSVKTKINNLYYSGFCQAVTELYK